jgi:uncharacterized protein YjbI with pentapeptide repeats
MILVFASPALKRWANEFRRYAADTGTLSATNLSAANLSAANFSATNLYSANLHATNLSATNLYRTSDSGHWCGVSEVRLHEAAFRP